MSFVEIRELPEDKRHSYDVERDKYSDLAMRDVIRNVAIIHSNMDDVLRVPPSHLVGTKRGEDHDRAMARWAGFNHGTGCLYDVRHHSVLNRMFNLKPEDYEKALGKGVLGHTERNSYYWEFKKLTFLVTKYPVIPSDWTPGKILEAVEEMGPVLINSQRDKKRLRRKGFVIQEIAQVDLSLVKKDMRAWLRRKREASKRSAQRRERDVHARVATSHELRRILGHLMSHIHDQAEKRAKKGLPKDELISVRVELTVRSHLKDEVAQCVLDLVQYLKRKIGAKATKELVRKTKAYQTWCQIRPGKWGYRGKPLLPELLKRYKKDNVRRPAEDKVFERAIYDLVHWAGG